MHIHQLAYHICMLTLNVSILHETHFLKMSGINRYIYAENIKERDLLHAHFSQKLRQNGHPDYVIRI